MKITVYTITDCEFSKQEKEYLTFHQLQFEEKNLETNKEFLTEMLAVSNNFAGTPVTKIEKDDGKIEVLKGFTKEDFNKALGFAEEKKEEPPTGEKKPVEEMKKQEEQKPVEEVKTEPATAPIPPVPTIQPPTQTEQPLPSSGQAVVPVAPQANDPLNSILADLQAKSVAANSTPSAPPAQEPTPQVPPPTPTNSGPTELPNVPDFQK